MTEDLMPTIAQQDVIRRYREVGNRLVAHQRITDIASKKFGLAYLDEHLADDISRELGLQDAFDDAQAELSAELLEVDVIDCGTGCYKIDALGVPNWFPREES